MNIKRAWLRMFIEEKGIDYDHAFELDVDGNWNYIPVGTVIEGIDNCPDHEYKKIKNTLIGLDFFNADIYEYFKFLAIAMVKVSEKYGPGIESSVQAGVPNQGAI